MQNGYFEFLAFFVDLSDPRKDRGENHQLLDMVGLALCGTIAGANSWAAIERFAVAPQEWLEQFLELPCGSVTTRFGGCSRCRERHRSG